MPQGVALDRLVGVDAVPRRGASASGHGRRDAILRRLLLAADLVAVAFAAVLAAVVAGQRADTDQLLLATIATLPGWALLFRAYGQYERDAKRISHTTIDDLPGLFHAVIIGSLLLWAFVKLTGLEPMVLAEVAAFGALTIGGVLVARAAVRSATSRILGAERVLLVGDRQLTNVLARKMRTHPEYCLRPIGLAGPSGPEPVADDTLPLLGPLDRIAELAHEHRVERVVVTSRGLEAEQLMGFVRHCNELHLKVSLIPETFDVLGPSVEVDHVEGLTVLGLNPPVLSRSARALKRSMDVAGALLFLVAALPLLVLIAIAIKVDSRGPVFFVQRRMGRGEQPLRVLKFRTMVQDAEAQQSELLAQSSETGWVKLDHDPRITRIGRLLRLTSLDELPQLVNVLKGEMSLVGPRPLIESEDCLIEGWARRRLDLTPGITGYWQVLGRTNIPFEEMVKLDYLYVTNWSLWTDIRLIFQTLPAVFTRRGAN